MAFKTGGRKPNSHQLLPPVLDHTDYNPSLDVYCARVLVTYTIQQALIPAGQDYQVVDVQIEADRITAIAPDLEPIGTVIAAQDKLLLPGFVNAHTHSSEMWHRGAIPPVPLELWIAALYDFAPLTPEKIYLSALGTAVETLLSGGTSVVDHLVLIPGQELESMAAAVRAYQEIGIRAFVGPLIQDQPLSAGMPKGGNGVDSQPYPRSTAETLELMADIVAQFHQPEAGINIAVAPTGTQLCSDALFQGCIDLSDRYNLCRHTHLLETKAQQKLAQQNYGCSAVEHLNQIGFLGSQTSLAHCVWLDDPDISLLAAARSTVVHNPLSNLRLGSGIAPILKYLQAGINVAFGCDGAASNDAQDLLEVIKIGSILHNLSDFDYHHWITPRQAIEIATLGGVRGVQMDNQLGTLTVGKKADLVLYDLKCLSLLPRTDPIGLLVLGRPTQAVEAVWVDGQQVVAGGQVTTVDVDSLRQALFHQSQWHPHQSFPTLAEFEVPYRTVMDLP